MNARQAQGFSGCFDFDDERLRDSSLPQQTLPSNTGVASVWRTLFETAVVAGDETPFGG